MSTAGNLVKFDEPLSDTLFRDRLNTLIAQTMTVTELARRTGLSTATIRNYTSGRSEPTLSVLRQLALALDTTVAHLSGEETDGSADVMPEFSLIEIYDNHEDATPFMALSNAWIQSALRAPPCCVKSYLTIDANGGLVMYLLDTFEATKVRKEGHYLLKLSGTPAFRTVQRLSSDTVRLIDDHGRHADVPMDEHLEIIGRVIWRGGRVS